MKNYVSLIGVLHAVLVLILSTSQINAAGHKDSISDSLNPASDVSDVYFFRSWQNPDNVVLIMNVYPGQNGSDGPVYGVFDKDTVYRLNVDNNMDGDASDVVYEIRFSNRLRDIPELSDFPFAYVGNPALPFQDLQGITSLTGSGAKGMRFAQHYSVTEIVKGRRSVRRLFRGQSLVAAPPNAGNVVMPDYEQLAAQGIYTDRRTGIKVFAGPRAEATYGDLGALFNGLNFGRMPPFMSEAEDINDSVSPFGRNRFSGTNVNTIALEIPISRLKARGGYGSSTPPPPFLGAYASTHVPRFSWPWYHRLANRGVTSDSTSWRTYRYRNRFLKQVSRMANPTLNILISRFGNKDRYNRSNPRFDKQFQDAIKSPPFAQYLSLITGLPVPPEPRLGILGILYKYPGQPLDGTECSDPCADLLHLNTLVPPTPPESQSRLGALLSPDPAGLPNGRRPHDDVYDITLRAFGGPAFFATRVGDGINFPEGIPGSEMEDDGVGYGLIPGNRLDVSPNGIAKEFPYLATPYSGGGF